MRYVVGAAIILGVLALALFFSFAATSGVNRSLFPYFVSVYHYEPSNSSAVQGVFVNVTNGAIGIAQWNESHVYVNATIERLAVPVTVDSYVQSGTLYVTVHTPHFWLGWYSVNLQIDIPRTLQAVRIQAATVNGGILVDLSNFSSVFATSVNGDVRLELGRGESVSASTINGKISFAGSPQTLKLSAVNGEISALIYTVSQGEYDLTTTNGNIEIRLPPSSSTSVYLATVNGALSVSGVMIANETSTRTTLSGTLGSGSASLVATTTNGDIVLTSS